MPDLHPYFRNINEAWEWYPKIEKQVNHSAKDVGRKYVISAAVSSEKYWNEYQDEIKQIAIRNNDNILVEIMHDAHKYWIVNVDYKIIDQLKQSREISCIQIDVENAQRLGIENIDENNQSQNPVIIHSAVSGGIERNLYMIFDEFKK
jgi:threonyl-tRNA synthetase